MSFVHEICNHRVYFIEKDFAAVLRDFSHKDLEIPTVDTTPLGMFGIFPGTNVVQVDNASDGARWSLPDISLSTYHNGI